MRRYNGKVAGSLSGEIGVLEDPEIYLLLLRIIWPMIAYNILIRISVVCVTEKWLEVVKGLEVQIIIFLRWTLFKDWMLRKLWEYDGIARRQSNGCANIEYFKYSTFSSLLLLIFVDTMQNRVSGVWYGSARSTIWLSQSDRARERADWRETESQIMK